MASRSRETRKAITSTTKTTITSPKLREADYSYVAGDSFKTPEQDVASLSSIEHKRFVGRVDALFGNPSAKDRHRLKNTFIGRTWMGG